MCDQRRRLAVIGAGPCGLFLLRAFAKAEMEGIPVPEILCFEKENDWGGMWNYTWRTGVDEYGDPVHSSMYRHLWADIPKECCEFSDYTSDQHFKRPVPSYLSREDTLSYIIGRMKNDCPDVRRCIQFNTSVRHVEFEPKNDRFTVLIQDMKTNETRQESFDDVVVAVGHYSAPNVPSFDGFDSFPGRIIHSHDFRDAREYRGQAVLVVGGSVSAEDIAMQLYKFGAKSVTISYRTRPLGYKWPRIIREVPLLVHVDGNTAHFKDGSSEDIDSVILCTGYKHHFPFMADNLRLVTSNRMYPNGLYKGLFFHGHPRLTYLGMQKFSFSFVGMDIQAWYVRDCLLGRITLPDDDVRAKDIEKWKAREAFIQDYADCGKFLLEYLNDLLNEIDGYPLVKLDSAMETIAIAMTGKMENIVGFRDQSFTSHYTGTVATSNPVPWIRAGLDVTEMPDLS